MIVYFCLNLRWIGIFGNSWGSRRFELNKGELFFVSSEDLEDEMIEMIYYWLR